MAAPKPAPPTGAPPQPADAADRSLLDSAGGVTETIGERLSDPVADAVVAAGRAQALSLAMLDAAAQLRRVSTLSLASIAVGLEAILDGRGEAGAAALEASEASLDRAVDRLARIVALADPPARSGG